MTIDRDNKDDSNNNINLTSTNSDTYNSSSIALKVEDLYKVFESVGGKVVALKKN